MTKTRYFAEVPTDNPYQPRAGEMIYPYRWRNNEKREQMCGRMYRIIARARRMNSVCIEFVDNGQREITSANAIRSGYKHPAGIVETKTIALEKRRHTSEEPAQPANQGESKR